MGESQDEGAGEDQPQRCRDAGLLDDPALRLLPEGHTGSLDDRCLDFLGRFF